MTAGAGTEVDILVRTHGTEVGSALIDTGQASGHPEPAWDLPDLWAQPDPPDQLDLPELAAPLDPRDPPALLDPSAPLDPSDLLDPQGPPGLLVRPGLMLAAVPTKISLELVNIERAFARPVSRLQSPDPVSYTHLTLPTNREV